MDSVHFDIPQGSTLGLLLFSLYIPFGQLLISLGLNLHFYTDDTQIFIHTKPGVNVLVTRVLTLWVAPNILFEVMLKGFPQTGSLNLFNLFSHMQNN